ncbi:MAG TPA: gamma-glutamyltransferase [Acidimicrobiales bacterium]|nr:gamma-glutamyltransferase [Acidimicrobiales bacterium]
MTTAEPVQPVPTMLAGSGMVCAVDHMAAQAGLSMLGSGGSAADAAVAASAVMAVTTQHMCGMGGDLLAVAAAPGAVPVALESAGFAGAGADPERLRAEGHKVMPFRDDVRSVTVPGCVDGWIALHTRLGKLPMATVLSPARHYASAGFPASPGLVASVPPIAHLAGADDFAPPGGLHPGATVRRPGIARALAAVVADGRDGFYGGEFGEGLLALGAGYLVSGDMEVPIARWRPAISAPAWGHRVWTVPPVSQGYLALAGAWIADGLDLPECPDDPRWAHLLIEAAVQSGWDRSDVLHEGADGDALVDPARLAPRRAQISPDAASFRGGTHRPGGTIALCAVDEDRMGVCVLQSNAAGFGAHLAVPGVGIFLNNRGIGFSLDIGHPAEYGPGRRPPHTLSPLALTAPDGGLAAVTGTMGGDSQPQILLQLLARVLHAGEDPGVAVAAPRWILAPPRNRTGFDTWREQGPGRVLVEGHAPLAWDSGLRLRGHTVERTAAFSSDFGHAHYIAARDDHLVGASDPRARSGAAVGY